MPYSTADIRNVCLVGPSHAGKTLLTEALLQAGGKISEKGSIEKGTTVSDFTAREKEVGHSQYNSVCHLDHEGIHVNLIDTPGYRDFFGRALSVMPAAETAAIVINAAEGVEMMARRMMAAAIRYSYRNLGRTGTNPSVSTILVRHDGDVPRVGVGLQHLERDRRGTGVLHQRQRANRLVSDGREVRASWKVQDGTHPRENHVGRKIG